MLRRLAKSFRIQDSAIAGISAQPSSPLLSYHHLTAHETYRHRTYSDVLQYASCSWHLQLRGLLCGLQQHRHFWRGVAQTPEKDRCDWRNTLKAQLLQVLPRSIYSQDCRRACQNIHEDSTDRAKMASCACGHLQCTWTAGRACCKHAAQKPALTNRACTHSCACTLASIGWHRQQARHVRADVRNLKHPAAACWRHEAKQATCNVITFDLPRAVALPRMPGVHLSADASSTAAGVRGGMQPEPLPTLPTSRRHQSVRSASLTWLLSADPEPRKVGSC